MHINRAVLLIGTVMFGADVTVYGEGCGDRSVPDLKGNRCPQAFARQERAHLWTIERGGLILVATIVKEPRVVARQEGTIRVFPGVPNREVEPQHVMIVWGGLRREEELFLTGQADRCHPDFHVVRDAPGLSVVGFPRCRLGSASFGVGGRQHQFRICAC